MRERIEDWCYNRSWLDKLLLLFFFIYTGARYTLEPDYSGIFGAVNLVVHEIGHLIFAFLPEFFYVAGGTLSQLLVPVIFAFMFLRLPDYFAVSFCGVWLGTNFYNAAVYAADARAMQLPLVSLSGGWVYHDWQYMFSVLDLLDWDTAVAGIMRFTGFVVMWGSILAGMWIFGLILKSRWSDN